MILPVLFLLSLSCLDPVLGDSLQQIGSPVRDRTDQEQDDLVQKLRSGIEGNNTLSLSIVAVNECTNQEHGWGGMDGRFFAEIYRRGGVERVVTKATLSNQMPDAAVYHNEYQIRPDGSVISVQALFDTNGKQMPPDGGGNLMVLLSDPRLAVNDLMVRDRQAVYNAMQECGTAIWVIGMASLESYLPTDTSGSNIGMREVSLTAQGILGRVEVEVSPEHGWLPRRFAVQKEADSRIGNESVATFFVIKNAPSDVVVPKGAPAFQPSALHATKIEWRGQVLAYKEAASGVFYASEISILKTTVFSTGAVNTVQSHIVAEEITGVTDASCNLSYSVPDGYRVSVDGARQLPYLWDGGRAVPGIPELPITSEYQAVVVRGNSRVSLVVINAVGFVVLSALLFHHLRNRNKSSR